MKKSSHTLDNSDRRFTAAVAFLQRLNGSYTPSEAAEFAVRRADALLARLAETVLPENEELSDEAF